MALSWAQITVLLCWGVFLLYWFVNWGNVKPTKEKKTINTDKIRLILLGIVALFLLNHFVLKDALHLPQCQLGWRGCHSQDILVSAVVQSMSLQVVSIFLSIAGIVIAIVSRKTLAGNWSSTLDVKKGHELITHGIYHYVRHPIYTGVLLMLLATLFAFVSTTELVIITVLIVMFFLRIRKEEDVMTKTFPKEYPLYRKRTKALIPFIW